MPARPRPLLASVLIGTLAGLWLGTLHAEQPFAFATTPGDLPKSVVPLHYHLRIQPDLDDRTTTGSAYIELDVREPVTSLVLHARDLAIDSAEILDDTSAPQALAPIIDTDKHTVTLPVKLAAGPHALSITFRGKIGTAAEGFFVDKYPTPGGEKLLLGTQFEPTDARRVFPCWDEPVYRATYDITLVVPKKLMAVSNMPVVSESEVGDTLKEVKFARTPAMPSYLVAMFAGEFEAVEGEQDGVKLRILTTEGKSESARYALEATKRILAYYKEYFGESYPLPKLDQIGVPNAFATFGAMENWGCIAYIDTALLYDPRTSSQRVRQNVFTSIAHEIAHQWFGNLVTMAWWDNLWLNEGFASWLGTKGSDALNPEWQLWDRAITEKEGVLALDARKTTHPVQRPITSESEANDAFDLISYRKGQGFLRMLESYLGEAAFRAGLRRYFAKHRLSNTTTADLWAALGEASGKPVLELAAGWTEQPGFPIVSVSAVATGGQRQLRLEQTRFVLNDPTAAALTWKIPVTLANTADLGAPTTVLLGDQPLLVPWPAGAGTVKANVADTGFYRVLYDDELRAALLAVAPQLPATEQLSLLSDAWALTEAGREPAPDWLALVERIQGTATAPAWEFILEKLALIDRLERDQPGRRAFQAWAIQLLTPPFDKIGWAAAPGEAELTAALRAKLIAALGKYGDRAVIAECLRRFRSYRLDATRLDGNLRDVVLQVTGRYATREDYEQLHALARAATTTEDKRRLYGALQAVLDPELARQTAALSLSGELSTTEATRNLGVLALNEHADVAWAYARENVDALLAQTTFYGRNEYLPNIAENFSDAARADELEALTEAKLPPDARAVGGNIADLIRLRAIVKQRELPAIDAWIKTRVKLPE